MFQCKCLLSPILGSYIYDTGPIVSFLFHQTGAHQCSLDSVYECPKLKEKVSILQQSDESHYYPPTMCQITLSSTNPVPHHIIIHQLIFA